MRTDRQGGYMNALLLPLILAVVLLVASAGFGAWAFSSRGDYKNHSDQKAAIAVAAAVKATQATDAQQYAEEAKSPLKQFAGPPQYGAVTLHYPKTWSAYIIEDNSTALSAYFHPDFVPSVANQKNSYALRMQIIGQSYGSALQSYGPLVQAKKVTVTPYSLPKVPSVVGSRIDGQISNTEQGSVVILPVRNVTLVVFTESQDFESDFNNIILPNLTFSP